uniref:Secreted protein n=1 Tax=Setaria viridis TaxID=4556 RepID=A0A4U6V4C4_SETVI|nr:hypothetical protein SEVIR_3G023875v2 [Setaria viridis]
MFRLLLLVTGVVAKPDPIEGKRIGQRASNGDGVRSAPPPRRRHPSMLGPHGPWRERSASQRSPAGRQFHGHGGRR